ncbi:MAG: Ig-like domain-containing protein [Sandaracinaceae bacterium]
MNRYHNASCRRVAIAAGCALALGACENPAEPAAPTLSAVPALTNQDPLRIEGTAEAGALVQVRGGVGVSEGTADPSGAFAIDVALTHDQENVLLVSQVLDGVESSAAMARVTHDGMAPSAPSLDDPVTPTRVAMPQLRGMAEVGATIEIEGAMEPASGVVGADGRFAIDVALATSATDMVENELSAVAIDPAGNRSAAADVTIVFDPNLPVEAPMFDDPPAFTNQGTLTLTGSAEPGVGISVAGGATDGSAVAGGDGTFSVDVGLRPNAANTLLAFAVSGVEVSPAVTLRIEHDDMAPDAPSLDAQASPTGATTIRLTGQTEPFASLEVTGGAAMATGTADDAGAFSLDVMLTADASNDLMIVAIDRATNRSDAVSLSIVQDSTLEAPITVDPVMSPTAIPTVTLSGTAAANVMIEIDGGAASASAMSDGDGAWTSDVMLTHNARNELRVHRMGSTVETLVTIEHDDIAPGAPALNGLASPTNSTRIAVTGTTDPLARVSVTGATATASATAAADGRFQVDVVIATDAETTLNVIATDRAGNASIPSTATVMNSSSIPAAPTLDETNPPPTNMASYVVTGRVASPGSGVEAVVRGGVAEVTASTDASSGAFSATVMLPANATSMLHVVSREGAIESSEAVVSVTHDDIAPAAPIAGSMNASAGTCLAGIATGGNVAGAMGSVEGRARVQVENVTRSRTATASATDMGSFTVSLPSCNGDVIRVIAVDAASNPSAATEINAG